MSSYCASGKFPQGLKPALQFRPVAARLKSCPDTSCLFQRVLPQGLKARVFVAFNMYGLKPVPFMLKPIRFMLKSGLFTMRNESRVSDE
jgi:hypothetical protein